MAVNKTIYVVTTADGISTIHSTQDAANTAADAIEGASVEEHELRTTGKKGTKKRTSSSGESGAAPTKKAKTTKPDAQPLEGVDDVFLGKKMCFIGSMKLKRELMEQTATNHGAASTTKKMSEADVIVTGARLSDNQTQEISDNSFRTITEDEFKIWLTTGDEPTD
ncbi:hypothetical protein CKM354_000944500 [Cercospora kikuchii]|uniref:BRCT domain-containing protein n=1 Tax=Cercospora kikuchii TaxID=84275 RepID=A0A9P3CPF4_9PEZI|nr:uncharacterized protein CKM354_000944500 [Cercospora kikuchii]GIZ46316.1 hypothetical protein CKM354_000944500 [Cercospora kikuchii]